MPEGERLAGLHAGRDLGGVHLAGELVGDEDHHDVAPRGRLGRRQHLETRGLSLLPRGAVAAEADGDVDAAVAEIQRMGVPWLP